MEMANRGTLVDGFPCPVCRGPTPAPDPDVTSDQWAERFPTNHVLVSLMDTLPIQEGGQKCGSCEKADTHHVPDSWCQVCRMYLCSDCVICHQRFPALSDHTLVSIEDIRTHTVKAIPLPDTCHVHNGKELELYCVDHEVLCCANCVAVQHRKCDKVETVSERASELRESNAHTKLSRLYTTCADHARDLAEQASHNIEYTEQQKETI
jgi:hypothetical protein